MNALTQPATVAGLIDRYFKFLAAEVAAGRNKPATAAGYRTHIGAWALTLPLPADQMPLDQVRAFHLTALGGLTWHRIQAVQRLFTWGRKQQFLAASPFADVQKPPTGRRERTLSRGEECLLLRACNQRPTRQRTVRRTGRRTVERTLSAAAAAGAPVRPLRWFLLAMVRMAARPGEVRALRWKHYAPELGQFSLSDFKAKARRKDRLRARVLLVDRLLARALDAWRRRRNPKPDDFVFLNSDGKPWTKDAIAKAVAHARRRAGLDDGEPVVAYTLRHTAATRAANPLDGSPGATLPQIAAWMGHTTTRMTERYVHLRTDDMRSVAVKAAARPLPNAA